MAELRNFEEGSTKQRKNYACNFAPIPTGTSAGSYSGHYGIISASDSTAAAEFAIQREETRRNSYNQLVDRVEELYSSNWTSLGGGDTMSYRNPTTRLEQISSANTGGAQHTGVRERAVGHDRAYDGVESTTQVSTVLSSELAEGAEAGRAAVGNGGAHAELESGVGYENMREVEDRLSRSMENSEAVPVGEERLVSTPPTAATATSTITPNTSSSPSSSTPPEIGDNWASNNPMEEMECRSNSTGANSTGSNSNWMEASSRTHTTQSQCRKREDNFYEMMQDQQNNEASIPDGSISDSTSSHSNIGHISSLHTNGPLSDATNVLPAGTPSHVEASGNSVKSNKDMRSSAQEPENTDGYPDIWESNDEAIVLMVGSKKVKLEDLSPVQQLALQTFVKACDVRGQDPSLSSTVKLTDLVSFICSNSRLQFDRKNLLNILAKEFGLSTETGLQFSSVFGIYHNQTVTAEGKNSHTVCKIAAVWQRVNELHKEHLLPLLSHLESLRRTEPALLDTTVDISFGDLLESVEDTLTSCMNALPLLNKPLNSKTALRLMQNVCRGTLEASDRTAVNGKVIDQIIANNLEQSTEFIKVAIHHSKPTSTIVRDYQRDLNIQDEELVKMADSFASLNMGDGVGGANPTRDAGIPAGILGGRNDVVSQVKVGTNTQESVRGPQNNISTSESLRRELQQSPTALPPQFPPQKTAQSSNTPPPSTHRENHPPKKVPPSAHNTPISRPNIPTPNEQPKNFPHGSAEQLRGGATQAFRGAPPENMATEKPSHSNANNDNSSSYLQTGIANALSIPTKWIKAAINGIGDDNRNDNIYNATQHRENKPSLPQATLGSQHVAGFNILNPDQMGNLPASQSPQDIEAWIQQQMNQSLQEKIYAHQQQEKNGSQIQSGAQIIHQSSNLNLEKIYPKNTQNTATGNIASHNISHPVPKAAPTSSFQGSSTMPANVSQQNQISHQNMPLQMAHQHMPHMAHQHMAMAQQKGQQNMPPQIVHQHMPQQMGQQSMPPQMAHQHMPQQMAHPHMPQQMGQQQIASKSSTSESVAVFEGVGLQTMQRFQSSGLFGGGALQCKPVRIEETYGLRWRIWARDTLLSSLCRGPRCETPYRVL